MAGRHQEVMFHNQLQFNLNVPLTTRNMAASFHHQPRPITIERASAALPPSSQGFPMAQLAGRHPAQAGGDRGGGGGSSANHGFLFNLLSQDKMAAAVQMAQRDLKNQKLQQKQRGGATTAGSSSPESRRSERPVPGNRYWARQRGRTPQKTPSAGSSKSSRLSAREHDRNRAPRSSASQTPLSSPPRPAFINTRAVSDKERSDSPPTRDTPSLTRVTREPANDIEKLQLEMELCLQQVESVQRRALSENNTDFLRRGGRGRTGRDCCYLDEEEGEERRQVRAGEQSSRAMRTIYNLRQQVNEMERQAAKLPLDKATKKSQASLRLATVNKGAVRLLQTFVSQLPQQDLRGGLPAHFKELTELVRQVTALGASTTRDPGKVKDAKKNSSSSSHLSAVEKDLMAMVDQVERLDREWQQDLENRGGPSAQGRDKPPFVTKFSNDNRTKKAFVKEHVNQPKFLNTDWQDERHEERKAFLQAGIQTLLNAGRAATQKTSKRRQNSQPYRAHKMPPPLSKGPMARIPTRKPPSRRGFLLPQKMREDKERLLGQLASHFADPTITANLKATTLLHNPLTSRSSSEPPSPREKKRVNFAMGSREAAHYHASYPGARSNSNSSGGKRRSRSLSPGSRGKSQSRSRSRSGGKSPASHGRGKSSNSLYRSDSDSSRFFFSDDELSPSMMSEYDSPASPGRQRSGSPGRRSQRSSSGDRGERQRFFVGDADPQLVGELFPDDSASMQSRGDSRRTASTHSQGERRSQKPSVQERRGQQQRRAPILRRAPSPSHTSNGTYSEGEDDFDGLAHSIVDEAVDEATQDFLRMERSVAVGERAAAHMDNPTLENIMQALGRMERENDALRHKYSSVTYHDAGPRRRFQTAKQVFSEFGSDQPREPPAFEVTNTRPPPQDSLAIPRVFSEELSEDPIVFTKDSKAYRSHVSFRERGQDGSGSNLAPPVPQQPKKAPSALRPKTLLSMKQTVVERISDAVERFEYYQRGLKQHLDKRNPFHVYESVGDNILRQCCDEVVRELDTINGDLAENIYTSEFLDESGLPLAPAGLLSDFHTDGTAAQNLRDSAAAHRSVQAAVSKTVTSLMLPPDEPDFSLVTSPKRVVERERGEVETGGEVSPPWDTSLMHVYDATALYEDSVKEKAPVRSLSRTVGADAGGGGGGGKDEDTGVEDYDYDDDYTDISDDEEDETESPSP